CFLGGMEDAGILSESDEAVTAAVTQELREIAGVTATPRFTRIARWPRSMAHWKRAWRRTPAYTWRATPTRESASRTASAWASRRRRGSSPSNSRIESVRHRVDDVIDTDAY